MKLKVGVIFGGRSVEHEISVITANQGINAMDKEKYEIVPLYISKSGLMYTGEKLLSLDNYRNMDNLIKESTQVSLINDGNKVNVVRFPMSKFKNNIINTIDVAIPALHGTNGEDGTMQGYLETLNIPYVGCDIISSALGMDKIMMRRILKEANIPSLDYVAFYSLEYIKNEDDILNKIEEKINYPVIVKAGNLGSSVGIKKAKNKNELKEAIDYSMQYSDRIMVERAIQNLKEINCSVMGDMIDAKASVCEEPFGSDEILSYNDKYMSGGKGKTGKITGGKNGGMASLDRKIPADIPDNLTKKVQELAIQTFKQLGCSGISRIDFMIDKDTNELYVNEINTLPGALSFYLWEASGVTFTEEMDELIELAFKRQRQRENITYSYSQNILAMTKGKKLNA